MGLLLGEFEKFPRERERIGEMLLAYGEIEFILLASMGDALGVDAHTSARIFFRVNGEGARLLVADAILRPAFAKIGLKDKWITAYSAARFCKNVRNQYAHCHWGVNDEKLYFIDLDDDAKSQEDSMRVGFRPIDLPLIERQHGYFEYALGWLWFLAQRLAHSVGKEIGSETIPEPKSIPQPPRDNRPKKVVPSPPAGDS